MQTINELSDERRRRRNVEVLNVVDGRRDEGGSCHAGVGLERGGDMRWVLASKRRVGRELGRVLWKLESQEGEKGGKSGKQCANRESVGLYTFADV